MRQKLQFHFYIGEAANSNFPLKLQICNYLFMKETKDSSLYIMWPLLWRHPQSKSNTLFVLTGKTAKFLDIVPFPTEDL